MKVNLAQPSRQREVSLVQRLEAWARRRRGKLVLTLAAIQLVLQFLLLFRSEPVLVTNFIIDDSYYYLQSAWNFTRLGFPSFDGIHPTNGVQLLWFLVVTALALFSSSKSALLAASLGACFVLNSLCFYPLVRFRSFRGSGYLLAFACSLWWLEVFSGKYWMAMENSLHALVFWFWLVMVGEFVVRLEEGRRLNFLSMAVLTVLLVWTRIDSAAVALGGWLYCLALYLQVRSRRAAQADAGGFVAAVLMLAGGGALMAFAYRAMGGSFIPVSALVKLSHPPVDAPLLERVPSMFAMSIPSVLPAPWRNLPARAVIFLGSLVLVLVPAGRGGDRRDAAYSVLRNVVLAVLIGLIIYHVFILLNRRPYHPYYRWYRSPVYIFWLVVLAAGLSRLAEAVSAVGARLRCRDARARQPAGGTGGWFVLILLALILARGGHSYYKKLRVPVDDNTRFSFYRASLWSRNNLPAGAVCAAWNSGLLGFFSPQRVVNLDGLANSYSYYRDVLRGDGSVVSYLRGNRVAYIVDYVELPAGLEAEQIYAVEANKWGSVVRFWKLSLPKGGASDGRGSPGGKSKSLLR